ncbi:sensor histidine kinase [Rhodohalobacter mucosus]|uniref:histidine kinase n=1 Tax=Rhodohalobacter mucosus TaxID=2079485 RepID=A0A316TQF1_9BACT|nr:HAMP domain-containing sensor histidine kinase [Rhodohalobacter mucosus]PWN06028.1 two-component sensor histidine kinase [Rhodohalobacter mucosus]
MRFLRESFYAKIALVFMALMILTGILFLWIGIHSSIEFRNETYQKVNRELASEMAKEFQPFLYEEIQADSIRSRIQYLKGINPQVDIYLLGGNGMIKDYYPSRLSADTLKRRVIDLEPLDEFLNGAKLPLLGQDPTSESGKKPFSVAPIQIMDETGCYLYVILGGENYQGIAASIQNSYIMNSMFIGLALTMLLTFMVGLIAFRWLTSRIRTMSETVAAFEQGQLDERIRPESDDEIGQLGNSFDQMADTILANMKELRKTDSLRRELVANISHDLRSPLASIQGYLETIYQKDSTLSAKDRNTYFETILRNTTKLNKLVADLFDLSRLDAQDVEPKLEPVSMAELTQDLVLQFKPIAKSNGITLVAEYDEKEPGKVKADIGLMERAITNLIDNALKNTPEGGKVTVSTRKQGSYVQLSISDTGKGISRENLNRIFDRFYQTDTSRSKGTGAGLGLSIVQKIIEIHGSTLSVDSIVDKGTTFYFSLKPHPG